MDQLKTLKASYDSGLISRDEFERKRVEVIQQICSSTKSRNGIQFSSSEQKKVKDLLTAVQLEEMKSIVMLVQNLQPNLLEGDCCEEVGGIKEGDDFGFDCSQFSTLTWLGLAAFFGNLAIGGQLNDDGNSRLGKEEEDSFELFGDSCFSNPQEDFERHFSVAAAAAQQPQEEQQQQQQDFFGMDFDFDFTEEQNQEHSNQFTLLETPFVEGEEEEEAYQEVKETQQAQQQQRHTEEQQQQENLGAGEVFDEISLINSQTLNFLMEESDSFLDFLPNSSSSCSELSNVVCLPSSSSSSSSSCFSSEGFSCPSPAPPPPFDNHHNNNENSIYNANYFYQSNNEHNNSNESNMMMMEVPVKDEPFQLPFMENVNSLSLTEMEGGRPPPPLPPPSSSSSSVSLPDKPSQKIKITIVIYRVEKTNEGSHPYKCDACERTFTDSSNLVKHIRTHTKEKPYKCNFEGCDKHFSHSTSLKEHINTHSGQKPHQCNFPNCGMLFAHLSNLRRHVRIHTNEKPYQCSYCGHPFSQSSNWKKHLQQVHHLSKTKIEEQFPNEKPTKLL